MNSDRHPADPVVGDSSSAVGISDGGEAVAAASEHRPLSAPCSPAASEDPRPEAEAAAPSQPAAEEAALVPPDVVVRHLRRKQEQQQQQPQRQESMSSYEEVQRRILKRLASQQMQRWAGQPPMVPPQRAPPVVAMSTVTAASSSSDNDNGGGTEEEERRHLNDDDECEDDDLDSVASGGGYSASVSSSEGSEDHHHHHHGRHHHHHRHHIHGWSNPDHVEYGVRPGGDDHSLSSIEEENPSPLTAAPKFGFFVPHHHASRKRCRRQQTGGESSSELDSFSDGSNNRLRKAPGGGVGIGGEIHVHGGFDFGSSSFTGSSSSCGSSSCSTSSLLSGLSAHLPLLGGSSEDQSTVCSSSSSGTFAGATDGHKRRRLLQQSAPVVTTAAAQTSLPPPRAVSTAPSPPPQAVAVPARTYGSRRQLQQQQQAAGATQRQSQSQSQAASMAALSKNMSALQARMMQAAAQAQTSRPRPQQQQQQRKPQSGAVASLMQQIQQSQQRQRLPSEAKQVQQRQAQSNNPACLTNGLALMERTFKSKMQQAAVKQQQHQQVQLQSKMGRRLQQCQVQALPPSSRMGRMVRQRSQVVVTGNLKSSPEFYEDPTVAFDRAPIYHLGNDLVAHCVSFLEPIEVHTLLTAPLSKTFKEYYSDSSDLWKILCLKPPFFARLDGLKELTDYKNRKSSSSKSSYYKEFSSDESDACFSTDSHTELKHLFGQFRLLYTSFVRCMKYLDRIKADALSGKGKESSSSFGGAASGAATPTGSPAVAVAAAGAADSGSGPQDASPGGFRFGLANGGTMDAPTSLADFLARARRVVNNKREERDRRQRRSRRTSLGDTSLSSDAEEEDEESDEDYLGLGSPSSSGPQATPWPAAQQNKSSKDAKAHDSNRFGGEKKTRFGHSKLTQRLLGPSETGEAGHVDLPWSCAIYAIVNWMVAFADVQGIQVMCLRVLPYLLEDERQRTTAQLAGLTSIVVRAMVLFPDSVELHTAAFHTLVLLARPLGGREGMLFHRTMVGSTCGIFEVPVGGSHQQHSAASNGRATTNGTAVILDSMRRHSSSEVLQAMSCWSMVNIALIPTQKAMLVKLGGIEATANAMVNHPYSAEVQFRALFALINLVIPCDGSSNNNDGEGNDGQEQQVQDGGGDAIANYATEREMLDENVARIANLVVVAMKNFCSNEAILNRACLVLHNLSLNADYHTTLLWTPNCYQMLQWTMANYPHDKVVEQSAGGTLQRLQVTLRDNDDLRSRFAASLRAQQQQQQALLMQQQQQQADVGQQQVVLQQQH